MYASEKNVTAHCSEQVSTSSGSNASGNNVNHVFVKVRTMRPLVNW